MYIERLHIQDFRCFADTEFTLNYPGRKYPRGKKAPKLNNVNLFLGDNGSGKTSVFRAAVLSVIGPIISSAGFLPSHLVRQTPAVSGSRLSLTTIRYKLCLDNGDYSLYPQGEYHLFEHSLDIKRVGDIETIEESLLPPWPRDALQGLYGNGPAFFLTAFGASRRMERPEGYTEKNRLTRYQRVASMFEDQVGLTPLSVVYPELALDSRWDFCRDLVSGLLPGNVRVSSKIERSNGRIPYFESRGVTLSFDALSDGYRTFLAWIFDLLLQLARAAPEGRALTDIRGVVIVDEIDLLLHPEWQRVVVEQVATAFPNLQFLFSTHSPLVAGSVESSNIYVLEDDPNNEGAAVVKQYTEHIQGLSADQILTGSYFGLTTTRAQPLVDDLNELLLKAAGSDDPQIAVEYLKRLRLGSESNGAGNGADGEVPATHRS